MSNTQPAMANSSTTGSHNAQPSNAPSNDASRDTPEPPASLEPVLSPTAASQQAATKQSLKQWWTKFTKQQQQQQLQQSTASGSSTSASANQATSVSSGSGGSSGKDTSPTSTNAPGTGFHNSKGVFGVPLTESLKYAGVAISMVGPDGVNQVYGYIPIVVAKCGLFLKQKAVTVEGVFRISGSTRRMKELQDIFDKGPLYGKDVVWGPWSVHDAANVLRRYLNQMPEPVVPVDQYHAFRNALPPRHKIGDSKAESEALQRYKHLIASLPSSSKYLFCYVLDLLNVFARNHDTNLMPASNLAVVFQPGLIRSPEDRDYTLSIPGAMSIPSAPITGGDALSPPASFPIFSSLSRSVSGSGVSEGDTGGLGSSALESSGSQAQAAANAEYLQSRQEEIKINQEILEFLIIHQDHFVVLPAVPTLVAPVVAPSAAPVPIPVSAATKASKSTPLPIIDASARKSSVSTVSPLPHPTSSQLQSIVPVNAPRQPLQPIAVAPVPSTSTPPQAPLPSTSQPSTAAQLTQRKSVPAPIAIYSPVPVPQPSTSLISPTSNPNSRSVVPSPDVDRRPSKERDRDRDHDKDKEKGDRAPRKLHKKRGKETPSRPSTPSSGVAHALAGGIPLVQGPTLWDPAQPPHTALPLTSHTASPQPQHLGVLTSSLVRSPSPAATTLSSADEDLPLSAASSTTVRRSKTLPGSTGSSERRSSAAKGSLPPPPKPVSGDGRTSSASVINDEKMTGGQTVGTLPSMTGARPVTPPLVETVITAASPLQGDPKQPSRYIGLSKSEVQADTSATEFLIVGAPEAADRSKSRKSSGNSNRSARSARSARSSGTTASREASCTSRKLAGIANPSESLEVSVKSRRGSAAELRKRPRQTIANASSSEDLSASARATDSSTPASSPPSASTSGVAAPKHVQKNVNSPLPEAMPRRAAKKVAAQVVQDSASAIQDAVRNAGR